MCESVDIQTKVLNDDKLSDLRELTLFLEDLNYLILKQIRNL